MRWLQSGLRRDVCIVIAGLDDPTGQQTKAALERHYDDRLRPKTFHGALEALVSDGFLTRRQEGLADRYALTPAGERHLRAHYDWVASNLDATADDGGRGTETDAGVDRSAADPSGRERRGSASHGGDGKENR